MNVHKAVPAEHIYPEQMKSVGSRGRRIITRPPCFPPSAATQRRCMGKKEADDGPPARRGLCGYELLYTKQLNQEQLVGPRRRRLGGGAWRQAGKIRCSSRERLQRMWLQTSGHSHKLFVIDLCLYISFRMAFHRHASEDHVATEETFWRNSGWSSVACNSTSQPQTHTLPSEWPFSPFPASILAELSL